MNNTEAESAIRNKATIHAYIDGVWYLVSVESLAPGAVTAMDGVVVRLSPTRTEIVYPPQMEWRTVV